MAATLGLALYSLIAALGFARVFGDWEFVGDAVIIVVVGHGASLVLRRLPVPGAVAVIATLLALIWTVGYLHYPATFSSWLPTTTTWDVASADLALVRDQFRVAVAPVEYVGGWALLASIGAAFVVFASDTFAFRAHARGEALVPGAVLFVFVAALGADRSRIPLTLALVAAGFLAAALLRARGTTAPRTLLGRPRHPLTTILPAAAVAGGLVVLAAWVIGPRLPGATAEALVDTRNEGGGVTEVLSPLVDIRSRLVNRSAAELFVVGASAPAYWRATALPEFDGRTWGLPDRSLEDVEGGLQDARPGSTENRQELVISALSGPLVPAAAEPVAASGDDLRWNAETSTLVKIDQPLAAGDRFQIVSAMPSFSPEELRGSTSSQPPDPIYLELPDDFPSSVREQARVVTAGSTSAYDGALTLQNWFRSEFEYSIDIPQGHGNSAIEAFLRQRIGYCEQFAGTFAAMARSLGIPARVAVGFTPGLLQPDGTRSVLGRNAHAWPEVWFDQFGWVPFEPTPGRGAPGAESHTGVAPAQDESLPTPGELATGEVQAPVRRTGDHAAACGPSAAWGDRGAAGDPAVHRHGARPATRVRTWSSASSPRWPPPQRRPRWSAGGAVATPTPSRRRRSRISGIAPSVPSRRRGSTSIRRARRSSRPMRRRPSCRSPLGPCSRSPRLATEAAYASDEEVQQIVVPAIPGESGPRRWCRQVERIAADAMTAGGRLRRYFTVWR